jgi:hypothetical protein
MKFCKKCNSTKDDTCFRTAIDKRGTTVLEYLKSICMECEKQEAKRRYYLNKEKQNKNSKEYKEKNKEEIKIKRRQYLSDNKEHIKIRYKNYCMNNREQINKNAREYRKNNISIRLRDNFRNRLLEGIRKEKSTLDYLDTTIEHVMKWLESNFKEDMSWDNYGIIWNIDHTLPLNIFDLKKDEDIFICFNWRNLIPMYCAQNIAKSDKLLPYLIFKQEFLLKCFSSNLTLAEQNKTKEYINKYAKYFNKFHLNN